MNWPSSPIPRIGMYGLYHSTPFQWRVIEGTTSSDGYEPHWLPIVYERLGGLYR